jgi:hypothetical protein
MLYSAMRRKVSNIALEAGWFFLFFFISCAFFYEAFTHGVLLAAPGDGDNYFYPMHTLVHKLLNNGEIPLWNPYIFSGMPLLATNQTGALYPPTLISILLFGPKMSFNIDFILHYAMTGYFMFLYIRYLTKNTFVAFTAGISLAFVGYLYVTPEHITVIRTTPWLPLMLLMLQKMSEPPQSGRSIISSDISYASLLGIIIGISVLAGHAQSTVYFLMICAGYSLMLMYPMGNKARGRYIVLGMGAIVAGVIVCIPQILSTMELNSLSWRDERTYDFFSKYPFNISTIVGVLFPGTFGAYPKSYTGLYTFVMAVGGAILLWKQSTQAKFWTIIALVAFILSLGDATPLYKFMYHLPVYNMFRAPERHWYEIFFALCVLSALSLNSLLVNEKRKQYALYLAAGAAITMGVALMGGAGLADTYLGRIKLNIFVFIPIALSIAMAAWTYLLWKKPKQWLIYAALGFVLLEAVLYKPNLQEWGKYNQYTLYDAPAEAMNLMKDRPLERMAFYTHYSTELSTSLNSSIIYGVSIVGGYEPLLLKSYHNLTHMWPAGKFGNSASELMEHGIFLRMLGARVFIACNDALAAASMNPNYKLIAPVGGCIAFENKNALPRVYTPRMATSASSSGEAKMKFNLAGFDPAVHVILRQEDMEGSSNTFAPGKVSIASYRAHEVIIDAVFFGDGLLILADQYYPGWKAYIDGTETKVLRANEILRGVHVPRGRHLVTFRYEPAYIVPSLIFSSLALMVFLIIAVLGTRREKDILEAAGSADGNINITS